MIVGEYNLIIGKKNVLISELSISVFFHFSEQINYIFNYLKLIFIKIDKRINSPPFV